MKHTKKYILSQINQPSCSQAIDFEVHFQHLVSVFAYVGLLRMPKAFSRLREDSSVRLFNRIAFEGPDMAYRNTV